MNPEYIREELHKAPKFAIMSTETEEAVSTIAVFPSWNTGEYMNLLKHKNVRVMARFKRHTFSFDPPDHWSAEEQIGKAKWCVLVLEIANEAGRTK